MPFVSMQVVRPDSSYLHITRKIAGKLVSTMNATRRHGLMLANLTTRTWNNKPEFRADFGYAGGDFWFMLGADQSSPGGKHWHILDRGTSVRRVKLSRNWVSKTWPGRLAAGPGRGQVIGKGIYKGIEPRNFSGQIQHIMEKRFALDVDRAIQEGLR